MLDSTKETLIAARDLIKDEARWARGWYARDETGANVEADNPKAVAWCAMGALKKVDGPFEWNAVNALATVCSKRPNGSILRTNDFGGHTEILACFEEAIRLCS